MLDADLGDESSMEDPGGEVIRLILSGLPHLHTLHVRSSVANSAAWTPICDAPALTSLTVMRCGAA